MALYDPEIKTEIAVPSEKIVLTPPPDENTLRRQRLEELGRFLAKFPENRLRRYGEDAAVLNFSRFIKRRDIPEYSHLPSAASACATSACAAGWAAILYPELRELPDWGEVVRSLVPEDVRDQTSLKQILFGGYWGNDHVQAADRFAYFLESGSENMYDYVLDAYDRGACSGAAARAGWL